MAKAEANENVDCDHFWLNRVYPDAAATLSFCQAPLDEIKDSCIVVLDANVLLLPYRLGATSLAELKKLYSDLAKKNRIFLPGQSVREFLKHRADKIRDILRELGRQASQINILSERKIGFLESDKDYSSLMEISEKTKRLKKETLDLIDKIGIKIKKDIGSDPVSSLYREVFSDKVIELDEKDDEPSKLIEEMTWRYNNSIPPGYKDRSKPDEGIGDFVVWKTVLKIGAAQKLDCIFVTEDAKSDWWVQSEGVFQPRIELVEEYRRYSEGRTIHLLPLSSLLEILGAQADAVDEAKRAEIDRQERISRIAEAAQRRIKIDIGLDSEDKRSDFDESLDRDSLIRKHAELGDISHSLMRERIEINSIIKNPDRATRMAKSELSSLYRRRDEIESLRTENFRERRRIEGLIRDSLDE